MSISKILLIIGGLLIIFCLFAFRIHKISGYNIGSYREGQTILALKKNFFPIKKEEIVVYYDPSKPGIDNIGIVKGLAGDKYKITQTDLPHDAVVQTGNVLIKRGDGFVTEEVQEDIKEIVLF